LDSIVQSSRLEHLPAVELDSQGINDLVSGVLFSDSEDDGKFQNGILSDEDDAWN
jgi:hypothetical protein